MTPRWHKSSYSGANNACVEVGIADEGMLVRDTKDRAGGCLSFDVNDWNAFVASVR